MKRSVGHWIEVNGRQCMRSAVVKVLRQLARVPTVQHTAYTGLESSPVGDVF